MAQVTLSHLAAWLGRERQQAAPAGARPKGLLIWLHTPNGASVPPIDGVLDRLRSDWGPVALLQTGAGSDTSLPDGPRATRRFVETWQPDAAICVSQPDQTLSLDAAARVGLPLFLIDADVPDETAGRTRRTQRAAYMRFRRILAKHGAAAEAIRSLGPGIAPIEVTGPLTRIPQPLPYTEGERAEFAQALGTRPVWLAVGVPPEEVAPVLAAHRYALRGTHRLLLILVLTAGSDHGAMANTLRADGWSVATRGGEDMPADGIEVFLTDGEDEVGLWYRVAPLTYLGGTLTETQSRSPREAASLGSAIIAGPGGPQSAALDQFDTAGALRRIGTAEALGRAVADLLAPDRTATLAQRAWDIATEGAEVEERLTGLLADAFARAGH